MGLVVRGPTSLLRFQLGSPSETSRSMVERMGLSPWTVAGPGAHVRSAPARSRPVPESPLVTLKPKEGFHQGWIRVVNKGRGLNDPDPGRPPDPRRPPQSLIASLIPFLSPLT